MFDIPGIFEAVPLLRGEDIAPRATSSDQSLETTHFLHAVELTVREIDALILRM